MRPDAGGKVEVLCSQQRRMKGRKGKGIISFYYSLGNTTPQTKERHVRKRRSEKYSKCKRSYGLNWKLSYRWGHGRKERVSQDHGHVHSPEPLWQPRSQLLSLRPHPAKSTPPHDFSLTTDNCPLSVCYSNAFMGRLPGYCIHSLSITTTCLACLLCFIVSAPDLPYLAVP